MRGASLALVARAGGLLIVAALAGATVSACGEADSPVRATVVTDDPATTFAPLVRLADGERTFPIGARFLLDHAGLEWAGGPCGAESDVTVSAQSVRTGPVSLPPLVPARLGREPRAYRFRPKRDCRRPRPEVFTTAQRTRPFDTEDRPAGLHVDEGFNLDVASEALSPRRRLGPDGSVAGVPGYYAVERTRSAGRPAIRLSYWILFPVEEEVDAYGPVMMREGDWERVDVVAERGPGRGNYTPLAVEYSVGDRVKRVGWSDAELASGTHPVVYLERGRHTPRPTGKCGDCVEWRTWRLLRDVREEPWWGYGGGWGAIGGSDEYSGPLGPTPFDIGGASP
jgi:hypothetical protein